VATISSGTVAFALDCVSSYAGRFADSITQRKLKVGSEVDYHTTPAAINPRILSLQNRS
jgi:hypothetical protein